MAELYLPYPPSANCLWGYGRGRVFKTNEYKDWLRQAGFVLNPQRPETVRGPYKLSIQMRRGGTGIDLDNGIKPTNDLLQLMRVIENDKLCEMITARWVSEGYDGMYVRVEQAAVE